MRESRIIFSLYVHVSLTRALKISSVKVVDSFTLGITLCVHIYIFMVSNSANNSHRTFK
jgi:hypothetical protein